MTQRIIGETPSQRRWRLRFLLLPVLAGGVFALLMAGGALAVHDTGSFELDGNAVAAGSHDWDQVCYQATADARCGTTTSATATAASWTGDILNGGTDVFVNDPNATIFTGGGSKDGIDISSWAWKDGAGGLPDKDNLNHSFAARYNLAPDTDNTDGTLCPAGTAPTCDVLYFGSDRFDNSGDAQQGFWFFQNKITLGSVKSGGGFNFTGVHKNGDLLIISDFSNGGTTSTISIYTWDSTVSGNLKLLATSNARTAVRSAAAIHSAGSSTRPTAPPRRGRSPTRAATTRTYKASSTKAASTSRRSASRASASRASRPRLVLRHPRLQL
jgi:hypothetical protein